MSKLTIAIGLGGLALVWWLDRGSPDEARPATAELSSPMSTAPLATHRPDAPRIPTEFDPGTRVLPPLGAFASTVYRPLFVPGRRSVDTEIEVVNLDLCQSQSAVEPLAAPSYPTVSFIGSIEEDGLVRTLLDDGNNVRGVEMGKVVDGRTVLDIEPRRLTLGFEGEILELTILE